MWPNLRKNRDLEVDICMKNERGSEMCQRKEAVQVNDSNSGAKTICQWRAQNGSGPNSGVKIIYLKKDSEERERP